MDITTDTTETTDTTPRLPVDAAVADAGGDPDGDRRTTSRLRMTAVMAALLAMVAVLGYLFVGGEDDYEFVPPPLPYADGTLAVIEPGLLVMNTYEPLDGKQTVEFVIPQEYAGNFDIAHMRTHSSLAIPTRIYYEMRGDTYIGVVKTDAPLNTARS